MRILFGSTDMLIHLSENQHNFRNLYYSCGILLSMINKLIYADITFKIRGILYRTHNELGRYCNEKQYADSVENYLIKLGIKYEREKVLSPMFHKEMIGRNKVDFLILDLIVLEIKTKRVLTREDYYQVKRYLVALNKKLGILVNFRQAFLVPKRVLNSAAKE